MTPEIKANNARLQAEQDAWFAEMNAVVDADEAAREAAQEPTSEEPTEEATPTAPEVTEAAGDDWEAFMATVAEAASNEEDNRRFLGIF